MNSPFNQTARYELTILVPVYNEEDNMRALSARLAAYLPAAKKHSCVLFINDGSTDNSGELIREACREHKHFFFLEFSRNCGLSAAIKAGMDKALSPYVAYIDADLQTAPEELDLLTPYLDEYELVTGVRAKRKDTAFKKFQSRVANGFRRMMVKDGARDTGCPLKVMHTDMARRLPFFKGMHRFFAALVQMEGGRVKQVDVSHFPRVAGVSKFHLWNRLISPLMDCFAVRWMQKRHIDYKVKADNLAGSDTGRE
ncbi:glycosyltransferase family 2 protein [Mailhella massiliensis]|uniref:glycosyltransferase family 2 protein n=1 Tax=Mailhella massiliensis TaxID=1903261 RepID=UPI0023541D57|nr:glycosyltransferase family 2 protein [Mailhella massiliensis]